MGVFDKVVSKTIPFAPRPIVRVVANKYIAGETLNDAMMTARRLNAEGAMTTIDVLGEFVQHAEVARTETDAAIKTLDEIARTKVDSNLSIKLTSLGLAIDKEFCFDNVMKVVERAVHHGNFVRFDMENSPYTDLTIELFRRARETYPKSVGIVLQAYLRRTREDIRQLSLEGSHFRLCKGIYNEDPSIAFKDPDEIRRSFLECLTIAFENGSYVGIATHDDALLSGSEAIIRQRGLQRNQYEFQMLLGVRENVRRQLIAKGHRMRVYVPYGVDWYGYCIRRLKENPAIAGHVMKAFFTGG